MPSGDRPRSVVGDEHLLVVRDFIDLIAANSASARQRERVLRAVEAPVTPASHAVLRLIERHEPMVVSDVARRLNLDQSTVSRQLRPLEELELVVRSADDGDRRVAWLSLSETGRQLLDRVRSVALNDLAVALDDWSADDRAALALLLQRFRDDLLRTRTDESGWSIGKE
jgi:DNA-binding MarR family transcriptional regulator